MKKFSYLLAPVLLLAPGMAVASSDPMPIYRVEVIVLVHLDGQSDRYRIDRARDYSSLTDPLLKARQLSWVESETEDERSDDDTAVDWDRVNESLDLDLPDALDDEAEAAASADDAGPVQVLYPLTYHSLDQLGPEMRQAWRRLEDSGRYQALTWRAWHQPLSRQAPSRPVRVHDETLIQSHWLALDPLLGRPNADNKNNTLGLVNTLIPQILYRLDGSIRIRQRQFTHAEIELVWHDPIDTGVGPLASEHLAPGGYEIHRINQSRTIRPERLEYFDSGWLGVLIRIEPWESPVQTRSPGGQRAGEG